MIKDLDGSMVNVRLIETDISFWIYSGDPIFIENEEFISANFKIKFDSAPMEYLQECSTSEVLSESISSFFTIDLILGELHNDLSTCFTKKNF